MTGRGMKKSSPILSPQNPYFLFNPPFQKPDGFTQYPFVHPTSSYSQYFHQTPSFHLSSVLSKLSQESLFKFIQQQHQHHSFQNIQLQRERFNTIQKQLILQKQNVKFFNTCISDSYNQIPSLPQHSSKSDSFEKYRLNEESLNKPDIRTNKMPDSLREIENFTKKLNTQHFFNETKKNSFEDVKVKNQNENHFHSKHLSSQNGDTTTETAINNASNSNAKKFNDKQNNKFSIDYLIS